MVLTIVDLRSTERAISALGVDEHLWVLGIGEILVYVSSLGEEKYRLSICSVGRVSTQYSVKSMRADGVMVKGVVFKILRKICARPIKIVKNNRVDESIKLGRPDLGEFSYEEFLGVVEKLGLRLQVSQ